MSRSLFGRALSFFVLLIVVIAGTQGRALAMDTYVLPEDKDWSVKVSHKFSRGVVNVATGSLEVPKKTYIESTRSDQWIETVGRMLSGTFIGLGRTVIRTGAGVYDVVTFPFPIQDYDPILEPEYVF
jgi:putative exosortase-associated protein (TIGR04073 family)